MPLCRCPAAWLHPSDEHSFGRAHRDAPAAPRAARAASAGGTLLDVLLTSALEEVPMVQSLAAVPLPPALPQAPGSPAAMVAPTAPPPLRRRRLLPPPEMPPHVLASLQPANVQRPEAMEVHGGSLGSTCDSCLADTAASPLERPAPVHPALAQALSWLSTAARRA